jgi:hypothetical protein
VDLPLKQGFTFSSSRIRESQPPCESYHSRTALGSHFEETFMNTTHPPEEVPMPFVKREMFNLFMVDIWDMIWFLVPSSPKQNLFFVDFFFNVMSPVKRLNKK